MKKWKCTVCGYIHEGVEPPEKCPVCGADRSKFVEITPEADAKSAPPETVEDTAAKTSESGAAAGGGDSTASDATGFQAAIKGPAGKLEPVFDLMLRHHSHPISAHIPNGVLPVSVLFVLLSVFLSIQNLAMASFYNMIFVLLSMPLVVFTGYLTWQRKYGGNMTSYFITKIISAIIVTVSAAIVVIWWIVNPEVTLSGSSHRWLFVLLHLIMLAAAGVAGFVGGKLVFKD